MAVSATPTYEVPKLSLSERDQRWQRIRARMEADGLDCLVAYAASGGTGVQYLTQIDIEGLAIFPLDQKVTALTPERWRHWAQRSQDWVQRVLPADGYAGTLRAALSEVRAQRIGLVDVRAAGAARHQELLSALSVYQHQDATALIDDLRLVKSSEEIAMMERAAEIADRAISRLLEEAKVGVPENELHADLIHALLAGGCEPVSVISCEASSRPFHPVRRPSEHVLSQGDLVVAHMNARYAGYFAQPHVCVTVGPPSREVSDMFQACHEAFETFREHARPGANLGDVCRKSLAVVEKAGYEWVKEPLTHSIGLSQQEKPVGGSLPEPYPDYELQQGNVFVVHPWVGHMADELGIDSGGNVLVTKAGGKLMGRRPSVELFTATGG